MHLGKEKQDGSEFSGLRKKKKSPSTQRQDKQKRGLASTKKECFLNIKCKASGETDSNSVCLVSVVEESTWLSFAVDSDSAIVSEPATVTPWSVRLSPSTPCVENRVVKPVESLLEKCKPV